jgi:uncharacterized protein YeeX (DUF496 family)
MLNSGMNDFNMRKYIDLIGSNPTRIDEVFGFTTAQLAKLAKAMAKSKKPSRSEKMRVALEKELADPGHVQGLPMANYRQLRDLQSRLSTAIDKGYKKTAEQYATAINTIMQRDKLIVQQLAAKQANASKAKLKDIKLSIKAAQQQVDDTVGIAIPKPTGRPKKYKNATDAKEAQYASTRRWKARQKAKQQSDSPQEITSVTPVPPLPARAKFSTDAERIQAKYASTRKWKAKVKAELEAEYTAGTKIRPVDKRSKAYRAQQKTIKVPATPQKTIKVQTTPADDLSKRIDDYIAKEQPKVDGGMKSNMTKQIDDYLTKGQREVDRLRIM